MTKRETQYTETYKKRLTQIKALIAFRVLNDISTLFVAINGNEKNKDFYRPIKLLNRGIGDISKTFDNYIMGLISQKTMKNKLSLEQKICLSYIRTLILHIFTERKIGEELSSSIGRGDYVRVDEGIYRGTVGMVKAINIYNDGYLYLIEGKEEWVASAQVKKVSIYYDKVEYDIDEKTRYDQYVRKIKSSYDSIDREKSTNKYKELENALDRNGMGFIDSVSSFGELCIKFIYTDTYNVFDIYKSHGDSYLTQEEKTGIETVMVSVQGENSVVKILTNPYIGFNYNFTDIDLTFLADEYEVVEVNIYNKWYFSRYNIKHKIHPYLTTMKGDIFTEVTQEFSESHIDLTYSLYFPNEIKVSYKYLKRYYHFIEHHHIFKDVLQNIINHPEIHCPNHYTIKHRTLALFNSIIQYYFNPIDASRIKVHLFGDDSLRTKGLIHKLIEHTSVNVGKNLILYIMIYIINFTMEIIDRHPYLLYIEPKKTHPHFECIKTSTYLSSSYTPTSSNPEIKNTEIFHMFKKSMIQQFYTTMTRFKNLPNIVEVVYEGEEIPINKIEHIQTFYKYSDDVYQKIMYDDNGVNVFRHVSGLYKFDENFNKSSTRKFNYDDDISDV